MKRTHEPGDPRRHPDGSIRREAKVQAIRSVLCDGKTKRQAAADLGCDESALFTYLKDSDLVAEARALGPTAPVGECVPPVATVGQQDDFLADLPPVGAEDPEDPSPQMLGVVARAFALTRDTGEIDDLAGWPRGTVDSWFDAAAAGDTGAASRVAVLRRSRAALVLKLRLALIETRNSAAIFRMLQTWSGSVADVETVDLGLEDVEAELRRRGI